MAIPWLHVIRMCPLSNDRYKNIFYFDNLFRRHFLNVKNKIKQKSLNFYYLFKSFLNKKKYWEGLELSNNEIDFLFISHALNKEHLINDNDFYFGNIPEELKKNGYKVLLIRICHFSDSDFQRKKNLNNPFFTTLLSFQEELSILKSMKYESVVLKKIYKNEKNVFKKKILQKASFHANSFATRKNLRLSIQIKKLLNTINAKSIVTTYEGHAFEKIIFSSAREILPKIKCIGYQHTGSFSSSNSIYQTYDSKYNPDFIFTSGNDDLINFNNKLMPRRNIILRILGSSRGNLNVSKFNSDNNMFSCLVIPEGFISEIFKLFSFSLECAIKYPNIRFIWRLHPSIGFGEVFKKVPELKKIPKNIILSSRSLDDDIKSSRWCLYRGSTAIFKSISAGLRPIYLDYNKKEIGIDPLYNMNKENISSIDKLAMIINLDINDDYKELSKKNNYFKKICNNRYSNININVFNEIFSNNQYR